MDLFSGSVFERNIYCNSNIESRKRFSLADNTLKITPFKIYPDWYVSVATGIGPYVHFFDEVSGTNWIILNNGPVLREHTGKSSAGSEVVKEKTVLVGGVPYEVKSIPPESES